MGEHDRSEEDQDFLAQFDDDGSEGDGPEFDETDFLDTAVGPDGERIGDHRGAFGDYGATVDSGFLDQSFRERIVLVGVTVAGQSADDTKASLDELELLVDTAGADALDRIVQKRERPDPGTFVGRGKVKEILDSSLAIDADTVVFDDELSPGQQFNLEKMLKRTALDRTAVILDLSLIHI